MTTVLSDPAEANQQLADRYWRLTASEAELVRVGQIALQSSKSFARTEILRVIGRGGFGVVYEVDLDGQRYALKYIPAPSEKILNSFRNAFSNIKDLQEYAPGFRTVVVSQELSTHKRRYIQLMKLMDTTLADVLKQKKMTWQEYRDQYFLPIVHQLGILHRQGIFHRDLKADNIGISKGVVYLLDLDVLYRQLEGGAMDGFTSIYGAPEFGPEEYLHQIMHAHFQGVNPEAFDLVSLAHLWLAGQLGCMLPDVYREYLHEINEQALTDYQRAMEGGDFLYARAVLAKICWMICVTVHSCWSSCFAINSVPSMTWTEPLQTSSGLRERFAPET